MNPYIKTVYISFYRINQGAGGLMPEDTKGGMPTIEENEEAAGEAGFDFEEEPAHESVPEGPDGDKAECTMEGAEGEGAEGETEGMICCNFLNSCFYDNTLHFITIMLKVTKKLKLNVMLIVF